MLQAQEHNFLSSIIQLNKAKTNTKASTKDAHVTFAQINQQNKTSLLTTKPQILQLNITKKCNQKCFHCHVEAGPDRQEMMSDTVIDASIKLMKTSAFETLDLTGGAPELHPHFKKLILEASKLGMHSIDRCNLSILDVKKHQKLPMFLAEHKVEIVASLPCYTEEMTDKQRGSGTFAKSIASLKKLNAIGYGQKNSKLILTLVHNPVGPHLAPAQQALELDYRKRLFQDFGIHFTRLICMTNVPIKRFKIQLTEEGHYQDYMQLLRTNYNAHSVPALMCKNTLNVDYLGNIYHCDFNQMLHLKPNNSPTVFNWQVDHWEKTAIATAAHCFACTAGQGSSCSGATTSA